MDYTAYTLLTDFCIMSLCLFAAQIMRSKLKFFQNFYVPASLIAGFIGLIVGPQILDIAPFSSQATGYSALLVYVLFSTLFLGKSERMNVRKVIRKTGNSFFINMASELICFGLPLVVGAAILMVFLPDVFPEISILMPAGFVGGHGYAAAIGTSLNGLLGREDGVVVGQTFATIGLMTGIFGGVICINFATKKGATRCISEIGSLPESCKTGMVPEEERISMGDETVNPMAMDPLAWHGMLVLMASGLGYGAYVLYKQILPNVQIPFTNLWTHDIEIPIVCLTMICGLLIQIFLNQSGYGEYVDKRIIDRIGSAVTDYLVAFGVATIQIDVVLEYLWPIIILCSIGTAWALFLVFYVGRRGFRNYWFERSIFIFGYLTGVVAIGVTLLRIVDPKMKSGTLDDFGMGYTIQSFVEIFLVTMLPIFICQIGCIPVGVVVLASGIALLIFNRMQFGVHTGPMDELRVGESLDTKL